MSRTWVANGNIKPYRFVKSDTTADKKCLQSSTNQESVGISHQGTRKPPFSTLDDGYVAIAGEEIQVYEDNDECLLCAGAAVARGDNLKSDSDGRGITGNSSGDLVSAYALESATAANQLILVKLIVRRRIP